MSALSDVEAVVDEALQVFHAGRRDRFTNPEWSRFYNYCKVLTERCGATPQDLRRACKAYEARYSVGFSLKAVFDRWSELLALSEVRTVQPAVWQPRRAPVCPSDEDRARVSRIVSKTKDRWLRAV